MAARGTRPAGCEGTKRFQRRLGPCFLPAVVLRQCQCLLAGSQARNRGTNRHALACKARIDRQVTVIGMTLQGSGANMPWMGTAIARNRRCTWHVTLQGVSQSKPAGCVGLNMSSPRDALLCQRAMITATPGSTTGDADSIRCGGHTIPCNAEFSSVTTPPATLPSLMHRSYLATV